MHGVAVAREIEGDQPDSRTGDGGARVMFLRQCAGGGDHCGDARCGVLSGGAVAEDAEHGLDGVLSGFRYGRLLDHLDRPVDLAVGEQSEDGGLAAVEQAGTCASVGCGLTTRVYAST